MRSFGSLLVVLVTAAPAIASRGDCGHPDSDGTQPTAQDALTVLRTAVGQIQCPPWTCDTDGNGQILADDALRVLRAAVGLEVELMCPLPPTTSTTVVPPTTTTMPPSTTTTTVPTSLDLVCASPQGSFLWKTATSEKLQARVGQFRLHCDDADTGPRPCRCDIDSIEPVEIEGVGTLCVTQTDVCTGGSLDCAGGPPSVTELVTDHDIGACTGNPDCAGACTTYCEGLGKEILGSGCEGFCAGGVNVDQPCTTTSSCPGSLCNGKVVKHGQRCACRCVGYSGAAAEQGYVRCRVGIRMAIETAAPCGDGDQKILLGDQCMTLTSGSLTSAIEHANLEDAEIAIPQQDGNSLACPQMETVGPSGAVLVGAVTMIDTGMGDVISAVRVPCQ